jgi:hypothetical protein
MENSRQAESRRADFDKLNFDKVNFSKLKGEQMWLRHVHFKIRALDGIVIQRDPVIKRATFDNE